jgi:ABC-2 type transport system ATP-binding protein
MLTFAHVSKRFSWRGPRALDGVSLEVQKGEIFGLLGHNGAGKSTALGIMLGLVRPDAGEVLIGGVSVQRHHGRAMRKVGAIFEAPVFCDYLSGWDNLRALTSLSGFRDLRQMEETVELVGLAGRIRHRVRTYSHGMRQRLALAQALLPSPELLLLDEPTDGLDPEGIHEFRELVLRLRDERGLTILLNSHLLAEVEQICQRFAILRQGKLIYQGGKADLSAEWRRYRLVATPWEVVRGVLEGCGGREADEGHIELPVAYDAAELVAALCGVGVRVSEIAAMERSLESLYMEVASGL